MPKNLTERVMTLLENADPLDRLRFMLDISDATPELRAQALAALLADGWTRYAIAAELGLTNQAVYAWKLPVAKKRTRP